jgi:hypothetical protein
MVEMRPASSASELLFSSGLEVLRLFCLDIWAKPLFMRACASADFHSRVT